MRTAAERVYKSFRGRAAVAEALGIDRTTVYKWNYSKKKQGCEGRVPARYHRKLLEQAKKRGFDLKAEDLVEKPGDRRAF